MPEGKTGGETSPRGMHRQSSSITPIREYIRSSYINELYEIARLRWEFK